MIDRRMTNIKWTTSLLFKMKRNKQIKIKRNNMNVNRMWLNKENELKQILEIYVKSVLLNKMRTD